MNKWLFGSFQKEKIFNSLSPKFRNMLDKEKKCFNESIQEKKTSYQVKQILILLKRLTEISLISGTCW